MSFDFNRMLKREVNVGKKDQQLRLGAGVGLLVVAWMIDTPLLMLLAIILIATAVTRWCPAYSGMGKSTVGPGDTAP
jgi:hypothetical protein